MKIICSKNTLCEAIGNVSKAVATKSSVPALEGIKLSLSGNILELTGYDLEMGIRTSVAVKSEDSGEVIINARLLSDIARRMPSDEILITVDDNLAVSISSNNTKYDISAVSPEEYPDIPAFSTEKSFSVPQNILKDMINQTSFAVSTDEKKPILTGELFDIQDGVFRMVAIDGYRLALRTENTDCLDNYKFVVPSRTLLEVSRLLKDSSDAMCDISANNVHIVFSISGYTVFSRLLEGEFHNYKVSIPADFKSEVIIRTKDMIESLDRCSLLISEKNKSPICASFKNDAVGIHCRTALGQINDEIDISLSGEDVTIGFNNKFCLDALKACACDKIRLQLNGPGRPIKMLPLQSEAFTFLLMPVAIRQEM